MAEPTVGGMVDESEPIKSEQTSDRDAQSWFLHSALVVELE
jgi:hypothetical protein